MTDRSAHELDRALASALDDLARAVEFPPTPDLALAVADAVGAPRRTSWSSSGAFSRGLVAGMAAVLLLVGAVGAVGIGIGALQIRLAGESPLPTPVSPFPTRAFGREVTAEQADAAIAWPIVFPDDPVLGKPDHIFVNAIPAGGTVTFAWGDRPGYPASPDGYGVILTEFPAILDSGSFEKMVAEGTLVESVTVNGQRGWWVEGGYHSFFFRDEDGMIVDTSIRLVDSALIWEHQGRLAMRVEGAPDLESAMRVAESLE